MMKLLKILYLIALLFLIFSLFENNYAQSLSGSGTFADPYLVNNADDFDDIRNYAYNGEKVFSLTDSIDLSSYADWTPISESNLWQNTLLGNGYKIKNFTITTHHSAVYYYGLFGKIDRPGSATNYYPRVSHLIIDSSSITWSDANTYVAYVGFICGLTGSLSALGHTRPIFDSIRITENCSININSQDNSTYVGSAVGRGAATQVWSSAYVRNNSQYSSTSATHYTGGISGLADSHNYECFFDGTLYLDFNSIGAGEYATTGFITGYPIDTVWDCAGRGRLDKKEYYIGGIAGRSFGGQTHLQNCYAVVDTTPNTSLGGLVGQADGTTASIFTESFYYKYTTAGGLPDQEIARCIYTNNPPADTTGTAKPNSFLKNQDSLVAHNWDFTDTWKIDNGYFDGYPYLQWMDVYLFTPTVTTVSITNPDSGDIYLLGDTVQVKWTGTGYYDSTTVNGNTVLGDSSYTLALTTLGTYWIRVISIPDSTGRDSVYITVLDSAATIDVNTLTATETTFNFNLVTTSTDSVGIYLSKDSTNWTYISKVKPLLGNTYIDTNLTYSFPYGFYGASKIYVKGIDASDTTIDHTLDVYIVGVAGSQPCYYHFSSNVTQNYGYNDNSCKWVGTYPWNMITSRPIIQADTVTFHQIIKELTYATRILGGTHPNILDWAYYVVSLIDTSGGGSDTTNYKIEDLTQFENSTGIANGFKYYIDYSAKTLNCVDLVNGDTSTCDDISYFFNYGEVLMSGNTSLWVYEYLSQDYGYLEYDGTAEGITTALEPYKLDNPKIVLFEPDAEQGWWASNTLPYPISKTLVYDVESLSYQANKTRSTFRGIFSKATKHAREPYKSTFPVEE